MDGLEHTDADVLETIASDLRHDCLQTIYPSELERIANAIRADPPAARIAALEAEVARLRKALEQIDGGRERGLEPWRLGAPQMSYIAWNALHPDRQLDYMTGRWLAPTEGSGT